MKIEELKELIVKNIEDVDEEFKRVFHGRGNYYENYNFLTIDSIDKILFIVLFEEIEKEKEAELLKMIKNIFASTNHETLVLQRRYLDKSPCEVLVGSLKEENIAIENSIKYKISFTNKNIGFFPDMKIGHEYISQIAKDKNVLNLFSYTCAFSLSAVKAGASKVVNVDMSKTALTIGRANHHLNNLNTSNIHFMPYNILKSWNRIKKQGPYDIIIIDPPSFQKGSFAASRDYEKIIKKLEQLAAKECIVFSALNAPELDTDFIKNIFKKFAPTFIFEERLDNLKTFPAINEEKSLKNLIFKKEE
ncbi:class I SAM-dependent methyltransferase [Poseidonibacter ostreae]|uniref:SAM-dependent methyltransferase n=1 Tax=Poseidonibacter ostreae TaxID=2654171 RepID=A0A6L4WNW2_9BACT|nr:class I SAM-dependent methyltransferase [Poseidonibacter ostreae]KAB7883075.1 SAM-dependent methyltransferase [Poseidonibacter ostreae]KAB7885090.1 SAM-dependent methyltransferase [Poseidonibacter ostreae]KAB7888456.1 SAM-dependent methyltransferase [Poseidonibacter ostreae]